MTTDPSCWVKPEELLLATNALWSTQKHNAYFSLQKRQTQGITGTIVSTFDSILDNNTRIYPYRLVYHPSYSDISYLIATCGKLSQANNAWSWLEDNLLTTLHEFETSLEQLDYVLGKINALCARTNTSIQEPLQQSSPINTFLQRKKNASFGDFESSNLVNSTGDNKKIEQTFEQKISSDYKEAILKFRQTFNMPVEEKLVNWYSCALIDKLVWQGWIYLSQNHCCFYNYFLGKEHKLIIRWTDVRNLTKTDTVILPESIVIEVRQNASIIKYDNNKKKEIKVCWKFVKKWKKSS